MVGFVRDALSVVGWSGVLPLTYLLYGWLSAKDRAAADAEPQNLGMRGSYWAYRHRAFFSIWTGMALAAWVGVGALHLSSLL